MQSFINRVRRVDHCKRSDLLLMEWVSCIPSWPHFSQILSEELYHHNSVLVSLGTYFAWLNGVDKPVFETYGLLFCMKTVATLIIGVRVRVVVGLFS